MISREQEIQKQSHLSGFIQRRIDYIFISNGLQEFVSTTDILAPISTAHFPVLFSLGKDKSNIRGKDLWKFNSSLTKHSNYINEINFSRKY